MGSRPTNIALYGALVKIDKFNHDFYTFFALIYYDLALSAILKYDGCIMYLIINIIVGICRTD